MINRRLFLKTIAAVPFLDPERLGWTPTKTIFLPPKIRPMTEQDLRRIAELLGYRAALSVDRIVMEEFLMLDSTTTVKYPTDFFVGVDEFDL